MFPADLNVLEDSSPPIHLRYRMNSANRSFDLQGTVPSGL
jgi:hypothetical protein